MSAMIESTPNPKIGDPVRTRTVVVADDHEIVRNGIRLLFTRMPDWSIVAEARDGREAVELVERWVPSVLVADITMPEADGIQVTREVVRRGLDTKVVVFSMHDEEVRVAEALRAGAMGYVLKQGIAADLPAAVRAAAAGQHFLSPPLSARAIEDYAGRLSGRGGHPYESLTVREREVLGLAAQGLRYAEIGQQLGISVKTVNAHMAHLMAKLGVHSVRQLIRYTVERGLPA